MQIKFFKILTVATCFSSQYAFSQFQTGTGDNAVTIAAQDRSGGARPITTTVLFLNITPESRGGGMGDVGVATSPDANSQYWNMGKLSFIDKGYGGAISINPWLRNLINDMYLSQLSGFYRLSKEEVVGASLTYFDLGKIQFTDISGNALNSFSPQEFAATFGYSRKLSKTFGVGINAKYIHSNLIGSIATSGGTEPGKAAKSGAVDIGFYYTKPLNINGTKNNLALGLNISNLGPKMTYSNDNQKDFIPTNLRLGGSFTHELDQYNKVTFSVDANKLMVPTTPVYFKKNNSTIDSLDKNNKRVIAFGEDPNKPLIGGMLGSFSDAPGGFNEELKEITLGGGVEYLYNNVFAVRGGYFNESKLKGNRKYMTIGVGLRYNYFIIDMSYLVAFNQNNPLGNTLRFTLGMVFDKQSDSVAK